MLSKYVPLTHSVCIVEVVIADVRHHVNTEVLKNITFPTFSNTGCHVSDFE